MTTDAWIAKSVTKCCQNNKNPIYMNCQDIAKIIRSKDNIVSTPSMGIEHLLTDSRTLVDATSSLFFAIQTKRNTGCNYVEELYKKGVRAFILPNTADNRLRSHLANCADINVWYVKDVIKALQLIAANHRSQFGIPVVGITGSNGKTIVKDWLVQMIDGDKQVVASPKSYNSQIGVPLSVWQMKPTDSLAIFEAGISESGEMTNLRNVIEPTIGIFTNIGQAHDENFLARQQKIAEKLQLFTHCKTLIYCSEHKEIHSAISEQENLKKVELITWGKSDEDTVKLLDIAYNSSTTSLKISVGKAIATIEIPFIDYASVENVMHCITFMSHIGYSLEEIQKRCRKLSPVEMRLEMNEGVNNCLLVNDVYSLDMNSLLIAMDFLQHVKQHYNKTLILSDFVQAGVVEYELYSQVAQLIAQRKITKFIGIGEAMMRNKSLFANTKSTFYPSTDAFLLNHPVSDFENETILLKGARKFRFENIAKILQRKSHETIMEVDLNAMLENLNFFRKRIKPTTKLMAMVKASSYGMGKVEVANMLQFNHVDYLTVAYSDEGVELRRNGITLPIMVMNPEEESFADMIKYRLEPDIYSFRIFNTFSETVRAFGEQNYPIHIELDTGMHRLGFSETDIQTLADKLTASDKVLHVTSIFTHLACSEDPEMDDFTNQQIAKFKQWSRRLKSKISSPSIICHILNSSGIVRFPEAQMDMVRLGIGLYGISPDLNIQKQLKPVCTLKTKISQIKQIPSGDSVGYNRRWIANVNSTIAIIPIGYADGLSRNLGYSRGFVSINGKLAPIIGSICMDMCFVDISGLDCVEGDDVVIFGSADSINQLSSAANTIPYELFTSISQRVKRVYFHE